MGISEGPAYQYFYTVHRGGRLLCIPPRSSEGNRARGHKRTQDADSGIRPGGLGGRLGRHGIYATD